MYIYPISLSTKHALEYLSDKQNYKNLNIFTDQTASTIFGIKETFFTYIKFIALKLTACLISFEKSSAFTFFRNHLGFFN